MYIYTFILRHIKVFSVYRLCDVFGVGLSTFVVYSTTKAMVKKILINLSILFSLIITSVDAALYAISPTTTGAGEHPEQSSEKIATLLKEESLPRNNYIVIDLHKKNLTLYSTSSLPTVLPIISQGKPGSYYETIGGDHVVDWKEELHFSTLGHVYMPYSVHLFGNYFIHGVPYYPDGTRVVTEYSGGCVRLSDKDAKTVYDFVRGDTHIIVTKGTPYDFLPSKPSDGKIINMTTTKYMTAIVSLETQNQNDILYDRNSTSQGVMRRNLLTKAITKPQGNEFGLLLQNQSEVQFILAMNTKAKTLGMTNTTFVNTNSPAITTKEDMKKLNDYIVTYKTYLLTLPDANN